MIKCQYKGCRLEARYALYQLRTDFTKKWGHYCDKHDREIERENRSLRNLYPDKTWKEVKYA